MKVEIGSGSSVFARGVDGCLAMKVEIGSGSSAFERRAGADFNFHGLTPFFPVWPAIQRDAAVDGNSNSVATVCHGDLW
jgi:hypothetical protein